MSIAVIKKAFQALEVLAEADRPLALAELTRLTKFPKPTLYRILRSMRDLGYIDQEQETGFYFATDKLAQLGHRKQWATLKQRTQSFMAKLHDQFNETVNLGVLDRDLVRYVHVIETSRRLRHMVQPDATDAFYSTALGRAIVAHLPEMKIEELLSAVELKPLTHNTPRTKKALREELDRILSQGYAIDDEGNDEGVFCIAVPLMEADHPVAAVSVSQPKTRLTQDGQRAIIAALLAGGRAFKGFL